MAASCAQLLYPRYAAVYPSRCKPPVVDLFAAETGAILSTAACLLQDELNQISPSILGMVQSNLETRIFKPYLTEHFWWMGDGKSHMNNWTSWCTQNVLLSSAFCLQWWNEEVPVP